MKKYIFLILFVFFFLVSSNTFCQSEIDSLKNVFETAETSIEKIDAAIELSDKLSNEGNDETIKYLENARDMLKEHPDSLRLARLNRNYGYYFIYTGEYVKASKYFLEGIEISEKIGNIQLKNKTLRGLALLNIRTKNYKKAIAIDKRILEYEKQTNNDDAVFATIMDIAIAYGESGNFDEAEKYLLELYNSNPENKFYKAVATNNLSFIYNHGGKYFEALKYAKEAAEFSETFPDVRFRVECLTNYANTLNGLGENVKAEKIMKEIVELARKNKFIIKMNNAIGNLALNYEALGDYRSAYKYYKEFSERRDSLLNESTTAKINELQIKYETEKKDKELTEKTASIKEKNIILIYSFIGGSVFILISFVVIILYRKKNAAYKELVKKYIEIIKKEDEVIESKKTSISGNKKYSSSSLKDAKKDELIEKINSAIFEEKMFLQPDLSIGKLAQKLGSNSKYLSQVIHEVYNLSFSDFINQLRVKEAAKLLSDKSYRHFSFEGISELVGFHTKSSFNTYFKKFTGVTPSFFSRTSSATKLSE